MRKTINGKWLVIKDACNEAIEEFWKQEERDTMKILRILQRKKQNADWFFWLSFHLLSSKEKKMKLLLYLIKQAIGITKIGKKKASIFNKTIRALENPSKDKYNIRILGHHCYESRASVGRLGDAIDDICDFASCNVGEINSGDMAFHKIIGSICYRKDYKKIKRKMVNYAYKLLRE